MFFPPTSVLQARVQIASPSELESLVNRYFPRWLNVRGGALTERRKRNIERLLREKTPAELVRERIKKAHKGIVKYWDRDVGDIKVRARLGSIYGKVPGKGWGEEYNVSIYAFRTDQTRIKIECQCNENYFGRLKRGPKHVEILCMHAAVVYLIGSLFPHRVEWLEKILKDSGSEIRKFIDPCFANDEAVAFFLLDKYLLGRTLFEIDKAIVKRKGVSIYDGWFQHLYADGRNGAGFYVFVNRNIFSDEEGRFTPVPLKNCFKTIAERLFHAGYRHNGFVIEFQGTGHEAIAVEFVNKKGERMRFVCFDDCPPLVVKRKRVRRELPKSPFPEDFNPFHNLEKKGIIFYDDCSGRNDYVMIEIPSGGVALKPFIEMYRKEIPENTRKELFRRIENNQSKHNFYHNVLERR